MTAYVKAGDKVIVYAGNLNMGDWEKLLQALADQEIEVICTTTPGPGASPTGGPAILAVITTSTVQPPYIPDYGLDCLRVDPHHSHTYVHSDRVRYCKGVPS